MVIVCSFEHMTAYENKAVDERHVPKMTVVPASSCQDWLVLQNL